ncbi:MAG: hypothetical protein ACOC08_04525 [Campylobacterales bacterium]
MITDMEIRKEGLKVLSEQMGQVEAERFITLLLREPFDYTKWQQNLFEDRSIEDISKAAMQTRKDSTHHRS